VKEPLLRHYDYDIKENFSLRHGVFFRKALLDPHKVGDVRNFVCVEKFSLIKMTPALTTNHKDRLIVKTIEKNKTTIPVQGFVVMAVVSKNFLIKYRNATVYREIKVTVRDRERPRRRLKSLSIRPPVLATLISMLKSPTSIDVICAKLGMVPDEVMNYLTILGARQKRGEYYYTCE